MKKIGKKWFFVVLFLILTLAYLTVLGWSMPDGTVIVRGIKDIRWGMDVSGGVSVTFGPAADVMSEATEESIGIAADTLAKRLEDFGVSGHQIYTDSENRRIIVSLPWTSGGAEATDELIGRISATARLCVVEGHLGSRKLVSSSVDGFGRDIAVDSIGATHRIALDSDQIASARIGKDENGGIAVLLTFTDVGRQMFIESTGRLTAYPENSNSRCLTVCLDGEPISELNVKGALDEGIIARPEGLSGEEAESLVDYINSGALPFELQIMDHELIDATLGESSVTVLIAAGLIAFAAICLFMIVRYRLTGAVASVALLGQVAGILAAVSGFLPIFDGFTLTLPGVAGIVLSIGMGVDANIITGERICEEVRKGKTIDGAIDAGNENSFSSIFDGNVAVIAVSIILMGVFGPPDTLWSIIFRPLTWVFPISTIGSVYSFGYTLFAGVIFNFIMGVTASRIMLKSLSGFSGLRRRWLYGGGER